MPYERELALAAMIMRGVGGQFLYRQFLPRLASSIALLALVGVLSGLLAVVVLLGTYFALLHYGMDRTTSGFVLAGMMTAIVAVSAGVIAYTFKRLSQPLVHIPQPVDVLTEFWNGLNDR